MIPNIREFYQRRLPHWTPLGGTFFVTYRLADSLPKAVFVALQEQFEVAKTEIENATPLDPEKWYALHKRYFAMFDRYLHQGYGSQALKNDTIAQIVADSLHFYDQKRLELMAYCIMSNHVHVVFRLFVKNEKDEWVRLSNIMKQIKGVSANFANKVLNQSGQFWEHESYDHLVRDRDELYRIINYTLQNPVKATLCIQADEWKYSYINPIYNEFI